MFCAFLSPCYLAPCFPHAAARFDAKLHQQMRELVADASLDLSQTLLKIRIPKTAPAAAAPAPPQLAADWQRQGHGRKPPATGAGQTSDGDQSDPHSYTSDFPVPAPPQRHKRVRLCSVSPLAPKHPPRQAEPEVPTRRNLRDNRITQGIGAAQGLAWGCSQLAKLDLDILRATESVPVPPYGQDHKPPDVRSILSDTIDRTHWTLSPRRTGNPAKTAHGNSQAIGVRQGLGAALRALTRARL